MYRLSLAFVVVVAAVFSIPPVRGVASSAATAIFDHFDKRPVRRILIIGNSRTYYHDMPVMLRRMADSARTSQRYDVTVRALSGGSLEASWHDAETQRLLTQTWDDVIIQAESRAQSSDAQDASFHDYARRLISASAAHGVFPAFIVNWVYGESLFTDPGTGTRAELYDAIQGDYRALAFQTVVRLINTGAAWERVHAAMPNLPLYEDGNHPSLQGSYLSALAVYAYLSRTGTGDVTYVPWGMTAAEATQIRQAMGSVVSTNGS